MRFGTRWAALLSLTPRRFDTALRLLLFMLLVSCALPAASAPPTTSERLQTLAQTITFDWAKTHPLAATSLGLSDEDGQLDTPSEAENARDLAMIRGWENDLASIPLDGASLTDVDDAKLLHASSPALSASTLSTRLMRRTLPRHRLRSSTRSSRSFSTCQSPARRALPRPTWPPRGRRSPIGSPARLLISPQATRWSPTRDTSMPSLATSSLRELRVSSAGR
jgi:hypothetical protein